MTFTGFLVGLVWVAKDEYENPKWTGVPKTSEMPVDVLQDWNKQFGPTDLNKWAIPAEQNQQILKGMMVKKDDDQEVVVSNKRDTW